MDKKFAFLVLVKQLKIRVYAKLFVGCHIKCKNLFFFLCAVPLGWILVQIRQMYLGLFKISEV